MACDYKTREEYLADIDNMCVECFKVISDSEEWSMENYHFLQYDLLDADGNHCKGICDLFKSHSKVMDPFVSCMDKYANDNEIERMKEIFKKYIFTEAKVKGA